jgi:hypothetical protein
MMATLMTRVTSSGLRKRPYFASTDGQSSSLPYIDRHAEFTKPCHESSDITCTTSSTATEALEEDYTSYPVIYVSHHNTLQDDDVSSLEDSFIDEDESIDSSVWSDEWDDERDDMSIMEYSENDDEDCEYDSVQSRKETAAVKALVQAVIAKTISWPQIAPLLDFDSSSHYRHCTKRQRREDALPGCTDTTSRHSSDDDYSDCSEYSDEETVESSVYDPSAFESMAGAHLVRKTTQG